MDVVSDTVRPFSDDEFPTTSETNLRDERKGIETWQGKKDPSRRKSA